MIKKVLFICTNNSARSQMAEGLLRALKGDKYAAFSAGTIPTKVNPGAIEAMKELGIDISGQYSKAIESFSGKDFDIVVTVCDRAKQACPILPGKHKTINMSFEDPADPSFDALKKQHKFRTVRDDIKKWIEKTFQ